MERMGVVADAVITAAWIIMAGLAAWGIGAILWSLLVAMATRIARRTRGAKVLPMVRKDPKDRSYTRPKGAA